MSIMAVIVYVICFAVGLGKCGLLDIVVSNLFLFNCFKFLNNCSRCTILLASW